MWRLSSYDCCAILSTYDYQEGSILTTLSIFASIFEPTIDIAPTYKMLKLHTKLLTYKACFPTINLTPEDIDMFECDPHEFVHHINSPLTKFYNPWMSSMTLITDLVKHCGK